MLSFLGIRSEDNQGFCLGDSSISLPGNPQSIPCVCCMLNTLTVGVLQKSSGVLGLLFGWLRMVVPNSSVSLASLRKG